MEREPGGRERGPGPGGRAEGEAARTEAGEPLGRPRQARRRGFSWRTPVAALLIAAGCVPAPVSVLAVWTARSNRVPRLAVFAVAGALLTVLGFGIGGGARGLVVLAVFVITALGGLAVKYGLHKFVAAYLLSAWFVITLALPVGFHLDHIHTSAWAQALAWLIGSALMIAYTLIMWLVRGRAAQPVAEIPRDISPVKLTRPLILSR